MNIEIKCLDLNLKPEPMAELISYTVHMENRLGKMDETSITGCCTRGELPLVAIGHSHTCGKSYVQLWADLECVASYGTQFS